MSLIVLTVSVDVKQHTKKKNMWIHVPNKIVCTVSVDVKQHTKKKQAELYVSARCLRTLRTLSPIGRQSQSTRFLLSARAGFHLPRNSRFCSVTVTVRCMAVHNAHWRPRRGFVLFVGVVLRNAHHNIL